MSRTCCIQLIVVCMAGGNRSGQQLIVYLFGNILETLVLVYVETGRSWYNYTGVTCKLAGPCLTQWVFTAGVLISKSSASISLF